MLRSFVRLNAFRFLVLPSIAFAGLAIPTAAPVLIPILNLVVIALSVNVCVAFGPEVIRALFSSRQLDKTDYLALGIFTSWAALVLRSAWSLAWRAVGEPRWMIDTDFSSFFIALAAYGAVMHLIAPGAIKDHVPTRKWVMIGAWVALAVFLGLVMAYSSDLQDQIKHFATPNDHAPTRMQYVVPL